MFVQVIFCVISETGRTSNCTDWRTDHTLRGDTRQTQPRATATATVTATVRAETLVENHGRARDSERRSPGDGSNVVGCAAVV